MVSTLRALVKCVVGAKQGTIGRGEAPRKDCQNRNKGGSSDRLVSALEMAEAISIETSRIYKSKEKKDWKESPEDICRGTIPGKGGSGSLDPQHPHRMKSWTDMTPHL